MALATGLYGGLHALAWEVHFRSRAEQALWQASSLAIALTALLYTVRAVVEEGTWKLLRFLYQVFQPANTSTSLGLKQLLAVMLTWSIIYLPRAVMIAMLPGYVLCRVFLVVESFLQMAHVPRSVLDVV